jgi:hypothetical protein
MKTFKTIANAVVVLLIVAVIGGILYVLFQFKEEIPPVKETKEAVRKLPAEKPKKKEKMAIRSPLHKRQIAIIIDDLGGNLDAVKALMKIDAELTFAVLPLQTHSREAAEMLHQANREVLLHLPMEPASYPREKPGEGALFTEMSPEELILQLRKNMASVPHAVGVNNHMGSKFMTDSEKLTVIFRELKKNRMFFIDSRTSPDTQATAVAQKVGLKMAQRKIFIDHARGYKQIYDNLMRVVTTGQHDFPFILIGHPHAETIKALQLATKNLRKQGIDIVPVSRLIAEQKPSQS